MNEIIEDSKEKRKHHLGFWLFTFASGFNNYEAVRVSDKECDELRKLLTELLEFRKKEALK